MKKVFCVLLCLALCLSFSACGGGSSKNVDVAALTLDAAIDTAIEKAGAEIEEVKINPHYELDGQSVVLVYLKGKDNLSADMIKRGMYMQARDILKILQVRDDIAEITFFWSFPLVDSHGNKSEGNVMKITLEKDTLDKLNYDNFILDNFPTVADNYFEHAALK